MFQVSSHEVLDAQTVDPVLYPLRILSQLGVAQYDRKYLVFVYKPFYNAVIYRCVHQCHSVLHAIQLVKTPIHVITSHILNSLGSLIDSKAFITC